MSHRLPLAAVLAVALLSAGCGTFQNIKRPAIAPPDNPNTPVCKVYGGLRSDFFTMLDYPWSQTTCYADYVLVPVLAVVDLTLDVFGDTFTLPISVVKATRRAFEGTSTAANYALPVEVPTLTPPPRGTPTPAGAAPLPTPRPVPGSEPTSPR